MDNPVRSLVLHNVIRLGEREIEGLRLGLQDLLLHFFEGLACWRREDHRVLSLYVLKGQLLIVRLLVLIVALIEYIRHCVFYMDLPSPLEVLQHHQSLFKTFHVPHRLHRRQFLPQSVLLDLSAHYLKDPVDHHLLVLLVLLRPVHCEILIQPHLHSVLLVDPCISWRLPIIFAVMAMRPCLRCRSLNPLKLALSTTSALPALSPLMDSMR